MALPRLVLAWVLLAAGAAGAVAETVSKGPLTISKPWARASIGSVGAAYFTAMMRGSTGDKLVRVTSPVAARVEMHTHSVDSQGVMRMRQIKAIAVEPGSPTVLKPGGHHLMLFGLKSPLRKGGAFPVTLHFEKLGAVTVRFHIEGTGARGPAGRRKHNH